MSKHEDALRAWALDQATTDRQIQAEMLWRTEALRRMVRLFYVLTMISLVLTVVWVVILFVAVAVDSANSGSDVDQPFGMLPPLAG